MACPRLLLTSVILAVVTSCASPRGAAPVSPKRIPDSAPEKAAALRSADRNLRSDEEDRRWGLEEARGRREESEREAQRKKTGTSNPAGAASTDVVDPRR